MFFDGYVDDFEKRLQLNILHKISETSEEIDPVIFKCHIVHT
jgi:hypothetical protein